MKQKKIVRHGGKFLWKSKKNNTGTVWGYWTFRR